MRAETSKITKAFINRRPARAARTSTDGAALYLHGHKIAWWGHDRSVSMTLAGWPTSTTRDRLNGVHQRLTGDRPFHQMKGVQYYNDTPIDAEQIITVHLITDPDT